MPTSYFVAWLSNTTAISDALSKALRNLPPDVSAPLITFGICQGHVTITTRLALLYVGYRRPNHLYTSRQPPRHLFRFGKLVIWRRNKVNRILVSLQGVCSLCILAHPSLASFIRPLTTDFPNIRGFPPLSPYPSSETVTRDGPPPVNDLQVSVDESKQGCLARKLQ